MAGATRSYVCAGKRRSRERQAVSASMHSGELKTGLVQAIKKQLGLKDQ
jgi:hypothetical protein